MSKTYSAGIVTAYGAAKRAGYQGTYEDFCRQQAGYAESAATVEQAKNTAVSAANTATTKAGEATTAATVAQTAKTQTEAAASQALTDIAAARSGAISAVQTEGATQTANARAQAQAAEASATTASTKASEASASATTATTKATEAAVSATSAANAESAARGVLKSIPQDYSDLSSDVDQLKADLATFVGCEYITFTNGKYIKTNLNVGDLVDLTPITAYNTNNYAIVDAQEGDKFTINATGGKAGRLWCFVDSNNVLLSVAVPGEIATKFVLTAPANASKLILNPVSGYGEIYKGEYFVDVTNRLENHVNALNTSVGTLAEELNGVRADLGDLGDLETTDKSSIVAAINEAAQSGGGGGGGSSTLSGLTDTSISGKADGQVLTYDGTSDKWVNRAPSGGGSVTVDTSLSGTSTNPVQNKIIKQALDRKAGTAVATTSANGLMSATDKSHLDSVYADYSAAITALGA